MYKVFASSPVVDDLRRRGNNDRAQRRSFLAVDGLRSVQCMMCMYVYIARICNFLNRGMKYNPDSYRCQTKRTDSVGDEIAGRGNALLLAHWRQQVMRTIEAAHFQVLENL